MALLKSVILHTPYQKIFRAHGLKQNIWQSELKACWEFLKHTTKKGL